VAQNWQEYGYPDGSFRVTFLADPQIKTTTYQVTEDREVEAHVYFVRRDNAAFKVTVAELADAGRESAAVIDYAIKMLSKGGEVKVNPPHHIMSLFGRQLSIVGADGKLSIAPLVHRFHEIDRVGLPVISYESCLSRGQHSDLSGPSI
jgi:hypothetical protein